MCACTHTRTHPTLSFFLSFPQVMEERRDILAKLQMVNIPDRMMALQSVISETLKVGGAGWRARGVGVPAGTLCWRGGHVPPGPAPRSTAALCPTASQPPHITPTAEQVNECTAELKANLQEEHLAGMEFIGTVFKVGCCTAPVLRCAVLLRGIGTVFKVG